MKKILFIILLFSSIQGNASKEGYVQKVYPSLLNKNFIVIANVKILWGSFGTKWGGREIKSFQNYLEPELIRDYLDRFYKFNKKTVLYLNPNIFLNTNLLSINGDTLFFQFVKRWDKNNINYDPKYDLENILGLLDYGLNNLNEIRLNQKIGKVFDYSLNDSISVVSIIPQKIHEILHTKKSIFNIIVFLNNTKKYPYKSEESSIRYLFLQHDSKIYCYFQNDFFHFCNKKNRKVFLKVKDLDQVLKINSENYLFNLRSGPIYNYHPNSDVLSILSYPELCYKTILGSTAENENSSFIVELQPFIEYDYLMKEYTYTSINKSPILSKTFLSTSEKNIIRQQRKIAIFPKKTNRLLIMFPLIASLVLLWVALFFIKINLTKKV